MNKKLIQNGFATQFQTGNEQAEIARKGGKASGQARREKKALKALAELIGNSEYSFQDSEKVSQLCKAYGITDEEVTHNFVIVAKLFEKAEQGDTKCAEIIARLQGEWTDKAEVDFVVPKINLECVGGPDE